MMEEAGGESSAKVLGCASYTMRCTDRWSVHPKMSFSVMVKNTFVHFSSDEPLMRRSHSTPARLPSQTRVASGDIEASDLQKWRHAIDAEAAQFVSRLISRLTKKMKKVQRQN